MQAFPKRDAVNMPPRTFHRWEDLPRSGHFLRLTRQNSSFNCNESPDVAKRLHLKDVFPPWGKKFHSHFPGSWKVKCVSWTCRWLFVASSVDVWALVFHQHCKSHVPKDKTAIFISIVVNNRKNNRDCQVLRYSAESNSVTFKKKFIRIYFLRE